MLLFIAFILFILLVVIHEYGHFLAAKRNGVEVEEFGIGFPPKIAGRKMGKGIFRSYYTINWLPLGGFVKLKGENDSDRRKGSFGATSFWVKTKIILAGVMMNFIGAIVIFTFLALVGLPQLVPDQFAVESNKTRLREEVQVAQLVEDSPAYVAGLRVGDSIEEFDSQALVDAESLFDLTESKQGQIVEVVYRRDAQIYNVEVLLNTEEQAEQMNQSYFGVGPADIIVDKYTWVAPVVGFGTTVQLSRLTYEGLGDIVGQLFQGNVAEASENVAGPVGIVVILKNIGELGYLFMLFFIGLISLTLAVMNSLPIPALDGGRLAVSGLFKIFNKPLSAELEQRIHGSGFAFLMLLILLITYADVGRLL